MAISLAKVNVIPIVWELDPPDSNRILSVFPRLGRERLAGNPSPLRRPGPSLCLFPGWETESEIHRQKVAASQDPTEKNGGPPKGQIKLPAVRMPLRNSPSM